MCGAGNSEEGFLLRGEREERRKAKKKKNEPRRKRGARWSESNSGPDTMLTGTRDGRAKRFRQKKVKAFRKC